MNSSNRRSPTDQGTSGDRAYDPAVVARAVTLAESAANAAGVLTADAAAAARRGRAIAGREADHLVAEHAAQDASAARFRADAAATRVRLAAEVAAVSAHRGEADPTGPAALLRASETAATVAAAAAAVAEAADELSLSVARAVTRTAELVAETRLALDRAIEAEVLATASALALSRSGE